MKGHVALALALMGLVCFPVVPAHARDLPETRLWTGTFTYAGGSRERSALENAIMQATRSMGPLARHIARSRLEKKTRPDPKIVIRVNDRQVGIAAGLLWTTPPDGRARLLRDSEGDTYRVAQRVAGHRIFQEIRDEDLVIRNVFALSQDGSRLAIRVSLSHERLPRPLVYKLTYRRIL